MSNSPVAPVSVAPAAPAAAALRAEILAAAENELLAVVGAAPDVAAEAPLAPAAAPPDPARQAVDAARAAAAGRQASLAPLFADLAQSLTAPRLPAGVKAAIGQVLALQLPASGPIAPRDIQQAIARSGIFLEANLAAAPPGEPAPAPADLKAALLTLQQALPAPPAADAPAQGRQTATPAPQAAPSPQGAAPPGPAPQGPAPAAPPTGAGPPAILQPPAPQAEPTGPATQVAEPAQPPATPLPPSGSKAATAQVPTPQLPAGGPPELRDIRPAIARSGPVPDAARAAVPPEAPAPLDPKTALLRLQQALPESAPQDAPAQTARPAAPPADGPPPAPRAAPPARDAALSPQGPASASLPAGASLSALVQHLRPQVEQALARLTLHQLASLPDGAAATWMFELPVATPQGAALAQFEVRRDPPESGGAGGEAEAAPWRARFSIDIEPLGPVHVHLAMTAGKAAVSVWAEREGSLERLRDEGAELSRALSAEVVFRAGAPGGATPGRGHFLDQTS
jgi:hypothetical protein